MVLVLAWCFSRDFAGFAEFDICKNEPQEQFNRCTTLLIKKDFGAFMSGSIGLENEIVV